MIRAAAAKGDVIRIGALSHFLREDGPTVGTTFEDTVLHMDYVANLVGVDRVGNGLDAAPESLQMAHLEAMDGRYSEFGFSTDGLIENRHAFRKITEISNLTRRLIAHGHSDEDVAKVPGNNLMRVFRKAWGS